MEKNKLSTTHRSYGLVPKTGPAKPAEEAKEFIAEKLANYTGSVQSIDRYVAEPNKTGFNHKKNFEDFGK